MLLVLPCVHVDVAQNVLDRCLVAWMVSTGVCYQTDQHSSLCIEVVVSLV